MTPRVSVLIPAWNRAEYLGSAIDSVLNQTYRDFEIIVVDDGSTDRTAALIKRYRQVLYVRQPHRGISAARNRALKEARGELIAWLDSDDLYAPDKLEKQTDYLDAHPASEIVFCTVQAFSGIPPEQMTLRQQWMADPNGLPFRTYLAGACVRRQLYDRFGGYDLRYPYLEDSEWIARVRLGGVDLKHCLDTPLYLRRIHDKQITFSHRMVSQQQVLSMYADAIRKSKKGKNDPDRKNPNCP